MVGRDATEPCPLLVVSNRGPGRTAGGLIVTLGPGARRHRAGWLAAAADVPSAPAGQQAPASGDLPASSDHTAPPAPGLRLLPLPSALAVGYRDTVANSTLWFLLHGLWDKAREPRFDAGWWRAWAAFVEVSERFAAAADDATAAGGTVLVQDYQLALVPALLARRRPDLRIAAFLHTPWVTTEELAVLPDPVAAALLESLSAAPCGFHTLRWARRFAECCEARLGRAPETYVSPGATDVDALAATQTSAGAAGALDARVGDRRLIVRVDRIEPSKNILRGFDAFDDLLLARPDLRRRVQFAASVYPSRMSLPGYVAYARELRERVDALNRRWGDDGWEPVVLDTGDDHARSVAALRRADVLLVNPVRDGLNLVAKEGPLVNERDAPLVLSREAGAWEELGPWAFGINPFDVAATAEALGAGLDLPQPERAERAAGLRLAAGAANPVAWFEDQMAAARPATPAPLAPLSPLATRPAR